MSKSTKIIAGVVAGLGMAALPLGAFATDVTSVTDTVSVTINPTCTFTTTSYTTAGSGEQANTATSSYSATVANGATASFNSDGAHQFTVVCNDNEGWKVTAGTPGNLTGGTGNNHPITYTAAALPSQAQAEGVWNAVVSGDTIADTGIDNSGVLSGGYIKTNGGIIATEAASTSTTGSTFTVTYGAYVGTNTAAGTYTGTIQYTLAAL